MGKLFGIELSLENEQLNIKTRRCRYYRERLSFSESGSYWGSIELEDLVKEIKKAKCETVIVDCGKGTVRYACRILNTVNCEVAGISFVLLTDELSAEKVYRISGIIFRVFPSAEMFVMPDDQRTMGKTKVSADHESVCTTAMPANGEEAVEADMSADSKEPEPAVMPDNRKKTEIIDITFSGIPAKFDREYKAAMENGFLAFCTGLYPAGITGTRHIKHVSLAAENVVSAAKKLTMNTNSAVFVRGGGFNPELFEELMSVPGLLSHFHFIGNDGNAEFDDSGLYTEYEFMDFDTFVSRGFYGCISERKFILRLMTPADYDAFRKVITEFSLTGRIRNPQFFIENECKLTNDCQREKNFRFSVDEEMNLYPCCNLKNSVGRLGDDEKKLWAGMYEAGNSLNQVMGCDTCRLNMNCSRCMAADLEEDVSFCSLLLSEYCFTEFLKKKNFVMFMYNNGRLLKNAEKVIIPNRRFSVLYQDVETGRHDPNLNNLINYLIVIDEKYYLYIPQKMALVTLDPKLFLIAEGDQKDAAHESIINELQDYCSISHEDAEELYGLGLNELSKSGICVDRHINWIEERRLPDSEFSYTY